MKWEEEWKFRLKGDETPEQEHERYELGYDGNREKAPPSFLNEAAAVLGEPVHRSDRCCLEITECPQDNNLCSVLGWTIKVGGLKTPLSDLPGIRPCPGR